MKKQILLLVMIIAAAGVVSGCSIKKSGEVEPVTVVDQAQSQTQQKQVATPTILEAIATSSEEVKYLPNGEIDTSDWKFFNSSLDSGTNINFSFVYPKTWKHEGSIDGGGFSNIPFYDIKKYSQNCYEENNNTVSCNTIGKIFEIKVSLSQNDFLLDEKKRVVKIDKYIGYLEEKEIENKNGRYPFISKSVISCTIPSVDGKKVEIVISRNESENLDIFDEILKSIKFF